MKRRLYFLIPDVARSRAVVDDLKTSGISPAAINTLAKPGIDLGDLPVATGRQRTDDSARIETLLWDGNLALYFAALLALVVMAIMRFDWEWLLLPATVMLVTFLLGVVLTSRDPNAHLSEFRDAMHRGELLLMVDVPLWRVARVEALVQTRHPEVTVGGVGWHIDALHT